MAVDVFSRRHTWCIRVPDLVRQSGECLFLTAGVSSTRACERACERVPPCLCQLEVGVLRIREHMCVFARIHLCESPLDEATQLSDT